MPAWPRDLAWPSRKPRSGRSSQRRRCGNWCAERPRSLPPFFNMGRRRDVRYWPKADVPELTSTTSRELVCVVTISCSEPDLDSQSESAMARYLWTQKEDIGPSARFGHAMAYDSVRSRTVLFGGTLFAGDLGGDINDTWEWNGEFWTQIADIGPAN